MIVRMWHGMVDAPKADEYTEFMKERAAPDYGSVEGLKRILFLRNVDKDVTHFLLVTHWESMESVKKFAGDRPEKAKASRLNGKMANIARQGTRMSATRTICR